MGNEKHPYKGIARYPYMGVGAYPCMGKFKQSIYGLPLPYCLMLYILSFIAVMAWRLCATFVVLFILTVPDLEYYALSLHRLLLDYPINLYIYNLQHTL